MYLTITRFLYFISNYFLLRNQVIINLITDVQGNLIKQLIESITIILEEKFSL